MTSHFTYTVHGSGPGLLPDYIVAEGLVASAPHAGVERIGIVGYLLGIAVAVRAATRHPERVTGLVLTAGLAAPGPELCGELAAVLPFFSRLA
jgi:pimeloyl-ACP methyl ester carboxylesterase